jgi:3-hydroxybutyryl-CoA dehydratase
MPDISTFHIGQKASFTKQIFEQDVVDFARVTGDENPIHLDEQVAKNSIFGRRVVHGALQAGLISAVLGMKLPGPGSIYREQTLTFRKPAFLGDVLTATVEIIEIKEKIGLLLLKSTVTNQDGIVLVDGIAKGLVSKE